MATWRVAKALLMLREQVNDRWPNRSKDSDGTIGDASHSARFSDHNPDENGVVCAMDITHDPQHGFDSYAFADVLRTARDKRIKYIISNRRICSSQVDSWHWRRYHGTNPHDHHVHISVIDRRDLYDSETPWNIDAAPMPAPVKLAISIPGTIRKGDSGEAVTKLQNLLVHRSIPIKVNGEFDQATFAAVKLFQSSRGLVADGVVGPHTWGVLKA